MFISRKNEYLIGYVLPVQGTQTEYKLNPILTNFNV